MAVASKVVVGCMVAISESPLSCSCRRPDSTAAATSRASVAEVCRTMSLWLAVAMASETSKQHSCCNRNSAAARSPLPLLLPLSGRDTSGAARGTSCCCCCQLPPAQLFATSADEAQHVIAACAHGIAGANCKCRVLLARVASTSCCEYGSGFPKRVSVTSLRPASVGTSDVDPPKLLDR